MLLILFNIRTRRVVLLQILWPSQFTQTWPKRCRVRRHFDEVSCRYPRTLYHCVTVILQHIKIATTQGRLVWMKICNDMPQCVYFEKKCLCCNFCWFYFCPKSSLELLQFSWNGWMTLLVLMGNAVASLSIKSPSLNDSRKVSFHTQCINFS